MAKMDKGYARFIVKTEDAVAREEREKKYPARARKDLATVAALNTMFDGLGNMLLGHLVAASLVSLRRNMPSILDALPSADKNPDAVAGLLQHQQEI